MSYFYSHLVKIESVVVALDELELHDDHKKHLSSLVDSTIHQEILGMIFDKLSGPEKVEFLKLYHQDPKDRKLLKYLDNKIGDIDQKISEIAERLKKELHQDIEESKKGK